MARALLVALPLVLGGLARAECEPAAGATKLTIRGFATAYFEQLRTNAAKGGAELSGGVCLVGVGPPAWTLAAQRVDVSGLQGEVNLTAADATLTVQGWSVTAGELSATRARLSLTRVDMRGHGVDGTARAATLDLSSGALQTSGLDLHGAAFYLRGDVATLASDSLSVTAPRVTSCHCAGPPLYQVEGASGRVEIKEQRVVLTGGYLDVGGLRVPLASTVTIDAQTLKNLALPLTVEYVAPDPNPKPGTGVNVLLTHLGLAPGVHARLGATGLDAADPLAGVALLQGSGDGASFTFGKAPGGMRFEETSDHAVTPWFDAGFDTRVLEPGNRDTLREGVLHGRLHADVAPVNGTVALTVLAAASSQKPGKRTVAGARLGARASFTAATAPRAPWGRGELRLQLQGSAYPDQAATQWGVDIEPGYRLDAGPVHLEAAYLARFTDSGSPFTTGLDRLEPLQRPHGSLTLSGNPAPGWSVSARLAAQYDLVGNSDVDAGVNKLDVGASLGRSLHGWRLTASADAALAGILAPNGDRDGYLQAGVTAARGGLELGARARYRYAPTPVGWDLVQLSAAVPLPVPGVTLVPYLALDFAPTLTSGALPTISGHGLVMTVPTCCGALTLGYRDDDGTWTVNVAVDLQTGAAPGGAAAACPSAGSAAGSRVAAPPATGGEPAAVPRAAGSSRAPGGRIVVAGAAAAACAAPAQPAGIMTGAAPGPP